MLKLRVICLLWHVGLLSSKLLAEDSNDNGKDEKKNSIGKKDDDNSEGEETKKTESQFRS